MLTVNVYVCRSVKQYKYFGRKTIKILVHTLFHPFPRGNHCCIIMDVLIDIFLCTYIIN